MAAPGILGLIAWAWVGRKREARTFAWSVLGMCLLVAIAGMLEANRMGSYVGWFAIPLIACAVTELAIVYGRRLLISVIGLSALCSPPASAWAATAIARNFPHAHGGRSDVAARDLCLATHAFQTLARAPRGVVLAEPDLGPFILATTPHSVVSAPYHRMAWGILTGRALLHMGADEAEKPIRRAGVSYVVVCEAARSQPIRSRALGDGVEAHLAAGLPPKWLSRLSAPSDPLQVYRVR